MADENEAAELLTSDLVKYFAIDGAPNMADLLRQKLADQIDYMMEFQLERLWAVLYRIDVSEVKVRQALTTFAGRELALHIADLVMERQLQKIESRIKHNRID